ncbi:hypothetical protein NOR_05236 [Metarhizium rileyi]|uniref:AB hydrolase-1 domain-containing protein n=1 Tax=Metarhizium rileyi (strain RCEF 4871) TaxID=1649241 RepID=A0A162JAS4_METRR|nr:hypothetical protein NOR_05236 [Metarhizium rileyi RCEF 4871]
MAQQLQLLDGRTLDYKLTGAPDGFPLFWIHGTPGAYTVFPDLEAVCSSKGLKLITMTRAGYGGSTRQRRRSVVDIVKDIQQLAEHINAKRCFVAGWSGGGPHALACAARLPGCVATLVIAGMAPWNAPGLDFLNGQGHENVREFRAALDGEEELRGYCDSFRPGMMQSHVHDFVNAMSTLLPDVDNKAIHESNTLGQFLVDNVQEGLKMSSDGWVDDDLAFIQPWGFELSEFKTPVLLYQGSDDGMVPFAHGEWLAENIPYHLCRPRLLQGQGHVSILSTYLDDMVDGLLEYL